MSSLDSWERKRGEKEGRKGGEGEKMSDGEEGRGERRGERTEGRRGRIEGGERRKRRERGERKGRRGGEKVDYNKVSSRPNTIHIYTILYKVSVTHAMVFETVVRP